MVGKGIFIIGTDTDVGKTFVTAGMAYRLRKEGYNACSFKPVQSGGILKENIMISEDVEFVKDICGLENKDEKLYSYCFKEAVSPHLAGAMEKIEIDKNKIVQDYEKMKEKYDYIIVEGSGGIAVPLKKDYFIYDLVKDLNLPAVIVGRAGVGTINHTILTAEFAQSKGIQVKGIIINGYTEGFYEEDNIKMIKNYTGMDIISTIKKVKTKNLKDIKKEYENSIQLSEILKLFK